MEPVQLLLELSYFDLDGRTKNTMGPERSQRANQVQLDNLTYIPMASNAKLKIAANTTSHNGHDYWTSLLFDNVNYLEADEPNCFKFKGSDNTEYYIQRLPANTQVKVNCSCLDFHYRFAVWNNKFRSLDGNPPPPYVKKTNRPPVNPMQSPGVCKHIIGLMDSLKAQNFFS